MWKAFDEMERLAGSGKNGADVRGASHRLAPIVRAFEAGEKKRCRNP